MPSSPLPLSAIRVIELSHMVMGPSMGLILGDMGADVVKVEPPGGDKTRKLRGSGAGYFAMYNRNKRSIAVDLKTERGVEIVRKLAADADVVIENFREGTVDKLGLGYDVLSAANPGLIYCSARGFLKGPYDHRTALDEVAQMMGGLAYMTGPPGRPLRAGASVIDVAGGMFGVIAILGALEARHNSGRGQHVTSALYETTAFLVGQHMAQLAVTGEAARPMPARISAWPSTTSSTRPTTRRSSSASSAIRSGGYSAMPSASTNSATMLRSPRMATALARARGFCRSSASASRR